MVACSDLISVKLYEGLPDFMDCLPLKRMVNVVSRPCLQVISIFSTCSIRYIRLSVRPTLASSSMTALHVYIAFSSEVVYWVNSTSPAHT